MTDETKHKIGLASKNRSAESNYKCGSSNRGKSTWMKTHKHTEESNNKNREKHLNKKVTDETKLKISKATEGKNNPMFGKHFYDIWIEKYGQIEADIKYEKYLIKLKNNNKK